MSKELDMDCSHCRYHPLKDVVCNTCDGVDQNNFQSRSDCGKYPCYKIIGFEAIGEDGLCLGCGLAVEYLTRQPGLEAQNKAMRKALEKISYCGGLMAFMDMHYPEAREQLEQALKQTEGE